MSIRTSLLALALTTVSLPCAVIGQTTSGLREDSVAYHPRTKFYFVYQRDSLLSWKLHKVLSPEDFLRYRETRLLDTPPKTFAPKVKERNSPSKLTFRATGDARISLTGSVVEDDSPTLPVLMRKRSYADVVFESNMALEARYGEHLKLSLKYNTQSALARNRQSLQLSYEGDRFDPVERLQAGHVSFISSNPLISSGSDLFGLRGDFRLGRLHITALASRQHDMERKIIIGSGGKGVRQFEWKSSDYQFARHFFLLKGFADSYDQKLSELPLIRTGLLIERLEVWVTSDQGLVSESSATPVTAYRQWALTGEKGSDVLNLPSAVRLSESDYYFSPSLGFLSLRTPLGSRQRLAVAFSYTLDGVSHQVGTFVSDGGDIELALLSDDQKVPNNPLWPLMMKNGYPLPRFSDKNFTLEIFYRNARAGIDEPADGSGTPWLRLFGLDRANASGDGTLSDGLVDNLPGVLFLPGGGTLFLPRRYPFESVPVEQEKQYSGLYTKTPYDARKETERDRFILRGTTEGSQGGSSETISLGSSDLSPGSVTLASREGRTYVEGVDFTIDYAQGTLKMLSPTKTQIEVTIREKEVSRAKEKNLLGLETTYRLFPSLTLGGTLLHYYETSPLQRLRLGEEPIKNTLWGLSLKYSDTFPKLTTLLDEWLPGNLTSESGLDLSLSYAKLHSGYNARGPVALEDFDQSGRNIGLAFPSGWHLGSNPIQSKNGNKDRRGLLAWFTVDPLLTRDGMEGQPAHLRNDAMERANPLVREWAMNELFPARDQNILGQMILPSLNVSFYPSERGPYSLDLSLLDTEGHFLEPTKSWGAMMFPIEMNDFQSARVVYLEGWFIDPYSIDSTAPEGSLFFDLGRISEDVIPDERAGFESAGTYEDTPMARVPILPPSAYAFDRTGNTGIQDQDTGIDGLSNDEERSRFGTDERLGTDPSGDDYRFYLDPFYDQVSAGILDRYKFINGTEGNSLSRIVSGIDAASGTEPDREDLDGNFLLDTEEAFYRYSLHLSPNARDPKVIAEKIVETNLPDGSTQAVRWLKFRIPLSDPSSVSGHPVWQDIRALRMSLTQFARPIHLRFTELRLVTSSWQVFDRPIDKDDRRSVTTSLSRLSLEEDQSRTPVPYVSPPGIDRNVTNGTVSLLRADEQSVSLAFENLTKDQPAAIFHNPVPWDLRHYRSMSLFTHLEAEEELRNGEVELFVRIGSDFSDNFYEIRLPLSQTPLADYSALSSLEVSRLVWPSENRLSVDLSLLPALKKERDEVGHAPSELYEGSNRYFVKGHPTLGHISSVLIGVRGRRDGAIKGEVWVNELTADGTREMGGDAVLISGDLRLSDLLRLRAEGGRTSAGFGSVTQDVRFAPLEDGRHFSVRSSWRLDKFLPESLKLKLPIEADFSSFGSTPLYSPTRTDLLYDNERDSTQGLTRKKEYRLVLDDWRTVSDQGTERPKFYSLSNLSLSYNLHKSDETSPQYPSRLTRQMSALLSYDFRPHSGDFIRLSSQWNRLYHKALFPSSSTSSLQSQWLWHRTLQLRLSPWEELSFGFTGSTTALVEEPFEAAHLRGENDDFRLFSTEILHSLLSLGSTQGYTSVGDIALRLPRFSHKALQSLSGTLTWQNNFSWSRGVKTETSSMGNDVTGRQVIDGRVSYDFGDLFPRKAVSTVGLFYLHFRQSRGSNLPGFGLEAGKALGVPSLYLYQTGLASHERQIRKAIESGWFLSSEKAPGRFTPSFYYRGEYEGSLSATPLAGLDITLSFSYRSESRTTLDALSGKITRRSGSLRMSTIGLKGIFEDALKKDGYQTSLFESFREKISSHPSPDAFLSSCLLFGGRIGDDALPALSSLLPNWIISYDLTATIPALKRHVSGFKLEHRYNGTLDVPLFDYSDTANGTKGIRSMTQTDDLSPLIGLNITMPFGLTLKEHYNRRRSLTMMMSSLRLLEQQDFEVSSLLSYSKNFPALFRLPFPLFEDADHRVTGTLTHLFTRSYLLTRMIETGQTSATQGLDSHRLQISLDYSFSRALTIRGFYELTRRRPLVSLYDYPFRRQTYGILFLFTLR